MRPFVLPLSSLVLKKFEISYGFQGRSLPCCSSSIMINIIRSASWIRAPLPTEMPRKQAS